MSQFLFRPAQLSDEVAVRALSAHIWDGEDYVPDAFQDWVADASGEFTVVYEGDELVAFGKLTTLGLGEWWLEGLRVGLPHQGRGLARRLHQYAVNLAEQIGEGMLRFMTASSTKAMHRLAEATGFQLISQHWLAEIMIEANELHTSIAFRPVTAAELPAVSSRLAQSPYFAAAHGLMEHEWVLLEIRPRLAEWQAMGRLYWWATPAESREGFVIASHTGEGTLWLNFLDAPEAAWPRLLCDVAALAAAAGVTKVEARPLATETMRAALHAAGWTVDGGVQLWAYERPLLRQAAGQ